MEAKRNSNSKTKQGKVPTRNVEYHEDAFEQEPANQCVPEERHKQLLILIEKLVSVQNYSDMDRARLEQQLKQSRSQVARLS